MLGKNALAFVFLLFLMAKTQLVLAQENQMFSDSTSFVDFLKSQGEILGLQFRLVDSLGRPSDSQLGAKLSENININDFTTALAVKDSIFILDSAAMQIQFLIYNEVSDFDPAQEYVSNLLRNGDIEPKTPSNFNGKDLISLASRERYSPLSSPLNAYIGDFKIFVVMLTISLFVVFAVGMIVFMLIYKSRKNKREKILISYDEQIIIPLSEILFEKDVKELESLSDEELYQIFPANQLKKPFYAKVLVERIMALNKNMKGDFKLKLKALYRRLGLDKITIAKLKSSKWDTVVTGLVEVNEMDLTHALSEVKKHVNSPNFYIRSQAVATILNLSESIDLSFLRGQKFPLSRWQQMNYLRIIKYLHATRNLHINTLFDSENSSIRLFGYKLVRMLGRVDLLAELEEKFILSSVEGKIEIIKTFEYLGVAPQNGMLNDSLQSDDIQLVSMAAKAAGTIGDEVTTKILYQRLEESPSFRLKLILLRSLQRLDVELYSQFVKSDTSSDLQRINKHLLDPLLQDV